MKISVLVPVFNAERYLRECLDSILVQDVDVFCCDDGSTDGSIAILTEYAASTPRLRFVTQPNRGVVATRNRLMDELPADYEAFAFCDSDDIVKDGMYARLAEAMMRTNADVAESGMAGNTVAAEQVVDDMSVYLLRSTAPGPWINVVNKLYRRSAVGKVRFRSGLSFEEDFFFNYEVNAQISRKVLLPDIDYVYRTNPGSATQSLNIKNYFASAIERVRLSLEVFLKAGRIPKAIEQIWRVELSKDIYRMCIRKNLRNTRDAALRKALFVEAGKFLARLEADYEFRSSGLNPLQAMIWKCCRNNYYFLALIHAFLT